MRKFIQVCVYVRRNYPKLWAHSPVKNRRIMVRYHMPATQLSMF